MAVEVNARTEEIIGSTKLDLVAESGEVSIISGDSGSVDGSSLNITAGTGSAANGGNVIISSGAGAGGKSGIPGHIALEVGGTEVIRLNPSDIQAEFRTPSGISMSTKADGFFVQTQGPGSGNGGSIQLICDQSPPAATGGSVDIRAGDGGTGTTPGGSVTIDGGDSGSTGGLAGDVTIRPGAALGGGTDGRLVLNQNTNPAGGGAGFRMISRTGPMWVSGSGTPEGVVGAPVGSLYTRTDGGAGTTLYVKETGVGNTGWVAK